MSGGGSGPGGNSLKWYRARRNLTHELWDGTTWSVAEIAAFLGVSPESIRRYLRDEEEDDASRPATPVG